MAGRRPYNEMKKSLDFGKLIFDVNVEYGTPQERLGAAQAALRSTQYGRGGVIKAEIGADGKVFFSIPATGETFKNIQKAADKASSLSLNEAITFKVGRQALTPSQTISKFFNKYGAADTIFRSIGDKAKGLTLDQKHLLKQAGIDIDNIDSMQADLFFMKGDENGSQEVAEKILRMREKGEIQGISILDDEGARVLQFRQASGALDSYQTNLLLNVTGHDIYDSSKLLSALNSNDPDAIAAAMEKAGKRSRAYFSAREISLGDEELETLVSKFARDGSKKSLRDVALIVDPQYELLAKYAKGDAFDFGGNKGLAAYYSDVNAEEQIKNILDGLHSKFSGATELEEFKGSISRFMDQASEGKGRWMSDQLLEHLKGDFVKSDERKGKIVASIFDSIEKSVDGSDPLNQKFLNTYKDILKNKRRQLSKIGDRDARRGVAEIDSILRRLENGELSQLTGRGKVAVDQLDGLERNIKNAWDASREFKEELSQYGMVISKSSLKGDTNIGTSSFILSGLGSPRDFVYADPVATAFHPGIFADQETLAAIRQNGARVASEFREAMESGVIPEKLMKMIKHGADVDIDVLDPTKRGSALRNREMMRDLLDMHMSGISPKDSPMMANLLHKMSATQAFREKGGIMQPVIPEMKRFAIDTERILQASVEESILGSGFDTTSFKGIAGAVDVMKFRVDGHKVLLPNHAVGLFHHSLGGFDLDDKGLPKLITYEDAEGGKRLASYMTRAPSGVEEAIFARMSMDTKTIQGLFDNTYFNTTLDKMLSEQTGVDQSDPINFIKRIMEGDVDNLEIEPRANEVEATLVRILDRQEKEGLRSRVTLTEAGKQKIAEHGSSSLSSLGLGTDIAEFDAKGKIVNIAPGYSTPGIYKTMLESGTFDMSNEIMQMAESSNISNKLKTELSKATNFSEMTTVLQKHAATNKNEALAFLQTAMERFSLNATSESSGSLGLYINRSMVAGSSLGQYEEFLEAVQQTHGSSVVDFMNKRYGIGLLTQETAIDTSVNMSTAKKFSMETARIIEAQGANINVDALGAAMGRMVGIAKAEGPVTLDDVGQAAISNLGKRIGFGRALDSVSADTEVAALGIDPIILSTRAKGGDPETLLRGIISGMEAARTNFKGKVHSKVDEQLLEYGKVLDTGNDSKIRDLLQSHFALSAESRFASLAKLHEEGSRIQALMEASRKMAISNIGSNPMLNALNLGREEEAVAGHIFSKHKEDLQKLFSYRKDDIKEFTESELYAYTARANKVGESVFRDLDAASKMQGITKQGLFDAMDKITQGQNFDIMRLKYGTDDAGELVSEGAETIFQEYSLARRIRKLNYHKNNFDISQDIKDLALKLIGGEKAIDVKSNIASHAGNLLDNRGPNAQAMSYSESVLGMLADRAGELPDDDIFRQQAQLDADIVRSLIDERVMREEGIDLAGMTNSGTLNAVDDSIGLTSDLIEAKAKASADFIDNADNLSKISYKRVSQAMKDGDIAKLMENMTIKKGLIGLGAVVAGSFAYKAFKNRTQEDIAGPPLLPGGSAYETDYPTRTPEIGTFKDNGYMPGVSYNVSIYGGRDQLSKFNNAAGSLLNGNIRTTMYNRLPNMKSDPYGSLASSY